MDKYLGRYAEQGTSAVTEIPAAEPWKQVVVIPVCNETSAILRPLPPATGRSLMILVVNETVHSQSHVSRANQDFAAEVHAHFKRRWQSSPGSGLSLFQDPASARDVLLVDRFSDGHRFPAKGGVGHARKTGVDLAAQLIRSERVQTPWVHCTDADVVLPNRYFSCSSDLSDGVAQETAALVYPFRHAAVDHSEFVAAAGQQQAIGRVTQLYEYSLRYYVAGLSYASSPYAFHTIGSTMAVNALHYARVRGFPRRQAGEDFYLLNKLAKVGSVRQLTDGTECEPIEIAARQSDRVPFGTGAATGKLLELENPAREFLLYHPAVFDLLRSWLGSLSAFWRSHSCEIGDVLSAKDLRALVAGLEAIGATEALQHALRQSADATQFKRQMHTWFDAFRTLKLIHYLRDRYFPSVSFEELMMRHDVSRLLTHEPSLAVLQQSMRKDWLGL